MTAPLDVGSRVLGSDGRSYRVASIEKYNPNQPRVPRGSPRGGQWTSGGGAGAADAPEPWTSVGVDPGAVPGAEHAGGIPAHLDLIANRAHEGRPSVDGFILAHGRGYPLDEDSLLGGEPHMCYKNSLLATMADPDLTYVEGYVSVHGVPIHHAWTVDREGRVRDHTLGEDARRGVKGYFGVPVRHEHALAATMRRGKYGILVHEQHEEVMRAGPGKIVARAALAKHTPGGHEHDQQRHGRREGAGREITNLRGERIRAPRTFYRGANPGDERRISTGDTAWDSYLFVADNRDAASFYGRSIERVDALPSAKILYEGTRDFRSLARGVRGNMLEWASTIADRARGAGYHAVWFKRQGDIGTAILDPAHFERGVVEKHTPGGHEHDQKTHGRRRAVSTFIGEDPYANSLGINSAIRSGEALTDEQRVLAHEVESEIWHRGRLLNEGEKLYRGASEDFYAERTNREPAFLSLTTDLAVAEEFATATSRDGSGVVYEITVGRDQGIRGLDTSSYQIEGMRYQDEVLLVRGLDLHRVGKPRRSGDVLIVPMVLTRAGWTRGGARRSVRKHEVDEVEKYDPSQPIPIRDVVSEDEED